MYVAITRARKRLYLSHSQTRMLHGQTRYNLKSRFFDELPEGALKWITPKMGTGAPGVARRNQPGATAALAQMLTASGVRRSRPRKPNLRTA
jgi:DNA helicase-2/ATP-dependent DNA helicase PcrA